MADTLEWGGNWTAFVDRPHYQLKFGVELAIIRERFENGEGLTVVV